MTTTVKVCWDDNVLISKAMGEKGRWILKNVLKHSRLAADRILKAKLFHRLPAATKDSIPPCFYPGRSRSSCLVDLSALDGV